MAASLSSRVRDKRFSSLERAQSRNLNLMDTLSKGARSLRMGLVRSRGGKSTERVLRMALVRAGVCGWKANDPAVFGKPDFVFRAKKIAVFVDGCFWHGCRRCYRRPKSHLKFWDLKKKENMKRRQTVLGRLRREGWTVLRIWEHEVRAGKFAARLAVIGINL